MFVPFFFNCSLIEVAEFLFNFLSPSYSSVELLSKNWIDLFGYFLQISFFVEIDAKDLISLFFYWKI